MLFGFIYSVFFLWHISIALIYNFDPGNIDYSLAFRNLKRFSYTMEHGARAPWGYMFVGGIRQFSPPFFLLKPLPKNQYYIICVMAMMSTNKRVLVLKVVNDDLYPNPPLLCFLGLFTRCSFCGILVLL